MGCMEVFSINDTNKNITKMRHSHVDNEINTLLKIVIRYKVNVSMRLIN
jgi:hypothetical protein